MADIATADGEHPTKRKLDDIKQHEEEELVDNDIAEGGVAGKMARTSHDDFREIIETFKRLFLS